MRVKNTPKLHTAAVSLIGDLVASIMRALPQSAQDWVKAYLGIQSPTMVGGAFVKSSFWDSEVDAE